MAYNINTIFSQLLATHTVATSGASACHKLYFPFVFQASYVHVLREALVLASIVPHGECKVVHNQGQLAVHPIQVAIKEQVVVK